MSAPWLTIHRIRTPNIATQIARTVQLIGRGILDGARHFEIRAYACGLASEAEPKDYLGQVQKIYDDFLKRWRYVRENGEWVCVSGNAIHNLILGTAAKPGQRGWGDCDDATVALGALMTAIGLPVQIVTVSGPGSRSLFTHVFPRVQIPRLGWVAVDAVGHPEHELGWIPPHDRLAVWDLAGQRLFRQGDFSQFRNFALGNAGEIEKKKGLTCSTKHKFFQITA